MNTLFSRAFTLVANTPTVAPRPLFRDMLLAALVVPTELNTALHQIHFANRDSDEARLEERLLAMEKRMNANANAARPPVLRSRLSRWFQLALPHLLRLHFPVTVGLGVSFVIRGVTITMTNGRLPLLLNRRMLLWLRLSAVMLLPQRLLVGLRGILGAVLVVLLWWLLVHSFLL
jgi:hypothetical protein